MFGRNAEMKTTVAEAATSATKAVMQAADAVVEYVDPLAKDEQLRRRIAAALVAGSAARQRARKQTGVRGYARRLGSDPVLRAQLIELGTQLQAAQKRAKKARTHKLRNWAIVVSGVAMGIAAVPAARDRLLSVVRRPGDEAERGSWSATPAPSVRGEVQGEHERTEAS